MDLDPLLAFAAAGLGAGLTAAVASLGAGWHMWRSRKHTSGMVVIQDARTTDRLDVELAKLEAAEAEVSRITSRVVALSRAAREAATDTSPTSDADARQTDQRQ